MILTVTIFNILTILTGLICLRKGGPVFLWLALFITALAFTNEKILVPLAKHSWHINRNIFYNLYSIAEIIAWFVIYYSVFYKDGKRLVLFFAIATFIYSAVELFVTGSFSQFHSNSYSLFSVSSLLLSLLYILRISLRDHHSLARDPVFYLCCAAVCFHSIFFLNLLTMLDPDYWKQAGAVAIFDSLQSLATCIYYFFICIAFIIFSCRPKPIAEHQIL